MLGDEVDVDIWHAGDVGLFWGEGTESLTDLEFYGAHVPNAAAKSEKIEQGDGLGNRLLERFGQRMR